MTFLNCAFWEVVDTVDEAPTSALPCGRQKSCDSERGTAGNTNRC